MSGDEKEKQAVALRYQMEKDRAPRVVASGRGEIARRIIEEAKKHGIPLYEDEQLASLLLRLPLNSEIPPELYQAVAEVLAFVYRLDGERHRKQARPHPIWG